MAISKFESIVVSERVTILLPALTQASLGIIPGHIYKLTFESDLVLGSMNIYQGSQLIYSSNSVFVGTIASIYDTIVVTERVTLDKRTSFFLFDSVTATENVYLGIGYPVSKIETITVSENISIIRI
jgi:hypothetical protein